MVRTDKILQIIFIVFALGSLLGTPFKPYPMATAIKALPIVFIALMSLLYLQKQCLLIAAGFIFSATGDVLLELEIENGFIFGLAAFLTAHLCYTAFFLRLRSYNRKNAVRALFFAVYGIVAFIIFIEPAGALATPVAIYISVITLMGITAALTGSLTACLAAAVFILSDSLLAWGKFISDLGHFKISVMVTYYLAQYLIYRSVRDKFYKVLA